MNLLIGEYGRILIAVLIAILLCTVGFCSFLSEWNKFGAVPDSGKTNFQRDEEKRTSPILKVKDIYIKKGQPVDWDKHMEGYDYDGKNISADIEIADNGDMSGFMSLRTAKLQKLEEHVGLQSLLVRVTSKITGKTTIKKMNLLVDNSWENS